MPEFSIRKIDRSGTRDVSLWKNLLRHANGATVFHSPEFLSYHKDKFNEYHIGVYKGQELFGIIPIAFEDEKHRIIARSPYGASFGGFVFAENLGYRESREIVQSFTVFLKENSVSEIIITVPLPIFYERHSDTFVFAMIEQGFNLVNCDVNSVLDLSAENPIEMFSSRARRMLKKADKEGLKVTLNAPVDDFWKVLMKTFEKHGTNPTHNIEQWNFLCNNLPQNVWCDVAYFEQQPVSGIGHIKINSLADSSFYLCSDKDYQDKQGLTLLLLRAILSAKEKGCRWFDFGTSSINMTARENIFEYKENFGCVGVFRNTYKLIL